MLCYCRSSVALEQLPTILTFSSQVSVAAGGRVVDGEADYDAIEQGL